MATSGVSDSLTQTGKTTARRDNVRRPTRSSSPGTVASDFESCFCNRGAKKQQAILTCQDACQVNHSHFESLVHQLQRDAQQQLHQQVAHDVLHAEEAEVENEQNVLNGGGEMSYK